MKQLLKFVERQPMLKVLENRSATDAYFPVIKQSGFTKEEILKLPKPDLIHFIKNSNDKS